MSGGGDAKIGQKGSEFSGRGLRSGDYGKTGIGALVCDDKALPPRCAILTLAAFLSVVRLMSTGLSYLMSEVCGVIMVPEAAVLSAPMLVGGAWLMA